MSHSFSAVQKLFLVLFFITVCPFLASCEMTQNYLKHDRENNMEPQDYRDALAPRPIDIGDKNKGRLSGNIPALKPYVAAPDTNYKPMPLVTISVNQTVPIRDVIYEIAEQAEYDVELDPRIRGSIIFSARNRPLDMVIERISDIAGLRFNFEDDMLRVEMDTPYHETYKINYLALTRTNASSISNNISVVAEGGAETGSQFSASNESVIDFWQELETNLTQIVQSNRDSARLATDRDPTVTVAQGAPAPVDPLVMDDQGNIAENGPNVQVAPPAAVLNVNAIAQEGEEESNSEEDPFEARFSMNRQAGLVSVFAPERVHEKVSSYLSELKKSATTQVLIEAKVLEVTLDDQFSAGIDWTIIFDELSRGGIGFNATGGLVRGVIDSGIADTNTAIATYSRGDVNATIDALSQFGTIQALASPRLTVLNNQSAVLNVAENVVYFEIESETTITDGIALTETTAETRTVPEGVLINVQPAIDVDDQLISMAIRPTITTITQRIPDPVNAGNTVPQVNVQEFDSIIQMNNGQAVVMGGLMQDRVEGIRKGVPVLGETPLLGALFRNQQDQVKKTELVVFLKATIVEGGNSIHATDKDLYRTFSSDRRPFDL